MPLGYTDSSILSYIYVKPAFKHTLFDAGLVTLVMKTPLLILFFLLGSLHEVSAQETSRKRMPLVVSHLSQENKALLRRKAAPKHTIISKVICFNKVCRGFIGWRKKQRSMRFKGFKKGGTLPSRKEKPVLKKDTLIAKTITASPPVIEAEKKERIFILDEVLFERNSSRLNEKFTFRLDSLVDMLQVNKKLYVQIGGHTDNTGTELHNVRLSTDRARAVAEYLIESNISVDRIEYEGYGSAKPIGSNATEAGRGKNRRVEIVVSE
jgi:outer membrane protein OmpA-like peptidoglycan-associated protein